MADQPLLDLDALEAAAKAATPGPWFWHDIDCLVSGAPRRPVVLMATNSPADVDGSTSAELRVRSTLADGGMVRNDPNHPDAAYIAAAHPAAVLALIAQLRAAEADKAQAVAAMKAEYEARLSCVQRADAAREAHAKALAHALRPVDEPMPFAVQFEPGYAVVVHDADVQKINGVLAARLAEATAKEVEG